MSIGNGRADFPATLNATADEEQSMAPILQAAHLRKYFPLRSIKLFGPKNVVHAVEDTSLALNEYRHHVQLVFQDPFSSLNPVHNVSYHLSRPLRIHGLVRNGEQEREQALSLLRRVSLSAAEQ